jgi:hypothetical protein
MNRYRVYGVVTAILLSLVLSVQTVSAQASQALEYHRFRFFINPALAQNLSDAELKRRLSLYVEDLNFIFAKQTIRRFTFNPATDITFTQTEPQTNNMSGQPPTTGFEIWASIQPSLSPDIHGSHGGYMGSDISGAGVLGGLRWDVIRDREVVKTLAANSWDLQEYWDQIHTMTHEIEHIFGAAHGEYYGLRTQPDRTRIAPLQDIEYFGSYNPNETATTDPYWSQRPDYWYDPLLGWRAQWSYAERMEKVRFANVTTAVINARIRPAYPWDYKAMLPDLSRTRVWAMASPQRPLGASRVMAWKVQKHAAADILLFDGYTNTEGYVEFPWSGDFNNYDFVMLIKVFPANGGTPVAKWYSIFDAQEQKMVYGRSQLNIEVPITYSAPAPTLTNIRSLSGGLEDSSFSISYNELAAVSNAYDASGLPISFRLESLGTGTLTKNGVAAVGGRTWLAPGEQWLWTPTPNANGNAVPAFSVKAHNGIEFSPGAVAVTVEVAPVNDAPSFTQGANQTVNEDAGTQSVASWATAIGAGPANESGQGLQFQISNSNNALFSTQPTVSPTGTLIYAPAENANGTATVTVKLGDDGGTANGGIDSSGEKSFSITVNAVNDAPGFGLSASTLSVSRKSGANTQSGWTTNIVAGPANESGQTVSFLVSNNNNGLFLAQPAISSSGTLTFTPRSNKAGTATVTVQAQDSGGTANGGIDKSLPKTFTIVIK